MSNEHPITPPPELVLQLIELPVSEEERLAAAYRTGADHQLNACCGFIGSYHSVAWSDKLRAACRPKPLSDKEQALADLDSMSIEPCLINGIDVNAAVRAKYDNIRRALKALPDSP